MFDLEGLIGIVAGICTATSLLPQLIKMVREKKSTDIALPMLIILLTGLMLWVWYGIMKTDWPIILTNCFSLIVNITIIFLRWYYKRHQQQA